MVNRAMCLCCCGEPQVCEQPGLLQHTVCVTSIGDWLSRNLKDSQTQTDGLTPITFFAMFF